MNRLFFITLFLLAVGSPCVLWAQGTVRGMVRSEAGNPVEFVNVGLVGTPKPVGTTTASDGSYSLQVPSGDTLVLRFSYVGYATHEYRIFLVKGESLTVDCIMKPSSTMLDEVVIRDESIRHSSFEKIDVQRIENIVGPQGGVESLIKTLPDVSSSNELSSQYSVRGGSFDENLVYINGVEVYRPQLVRSGQQEGMSIVNPDLVDHLLFSPGGFDASYGDKLSSVLDIFYGGQRIPVDGHRFNVQLSLLGGSLSAMGTLGNRFRYSLGARLHSNRYLFRSMDTEGDYTTRYADLQTLLEYRASDRLNISFLGIHTRNTYGLVPMSRTTTFGSFMESLELDVYFDGREMDRYQTYLGALTLDYAVSDKWQLQWITSAQYNREQELYDIQNQYWLYEVGLDETVGDTNHFDRGVGTFLEHARNYLDMAIYATELKSTSLAPLGQWTLGVKGQVEIVSDRMREWKWVDSAGYTFPTSHPAVGVDDTVPLNPLLQLFCNADNRLTNYRAIGYAQREINLVTDWFSELRILAGLRGQASLHPQLNTHYLNLSPRMSVSARSRGQRDLLYRFAAGVYQQPFLYRELRRTDGSLHGGLPPQCSYQAMGTVDWNLHLWGLPFRLTADVYYKYITHIVPYTIDNLRIRYNPDQEAVGYATGVSLRVNGDFVEGLESWASLSVMKTQEDIIGDNLGWLARPTDQRFSLKLFLQDYIPTIPWWRMSLNFIYGTGLPVTFPYQRDRSKEFRLPAYFRIDWGNTVQLSRFEWVKHSALGRFFSDLSVTVDVFNLFNYRNVVSYIWVADYNNIYYPVPNYLTARQLNIKLSATF